MITIVTILSVFFYSAYGLVDREKINIDKDNENYANIRSYLIKEDDSSLYEKKTIFLTFDDGPSNIITDNILDVLKEYNIKATFFVVGKEIKNRERILKRINDEGHGIGLHTFSHSFKKVYRSSSEFIKEIIETNDYVYEITGVKSKIIRFPGGSHKRLSSKFLEEIHSEGFKVFDWTHNSEDGMHPEYSPERLYKNSLRKIITKKKAPGVILLMHSNENNQNTIKALPIIIKHHKDEGYSFKIIDEFTPEYYSE